MYGWYIVRRGILCTLRSRDACALLCTVQRLSPTHLATYSPFRFNPAQIHSSESLSLRTYGLHCLQHTSPGSLDPNTLWDQATKFGVSFVEASTAQGQGEEEVVEVVLETFGELVRLAGVREDGREWEGVCRVL